MTDSFDLRAADAALLLIDLQERFVPAIPAMAADQPCGRNGVILAKAARACAVPTLISEQYPKGLGTTVAWIAEAAADAPRLAKTHFSCCDDEPLLSAIDGMHRPWWILAGVEAHVCVLATAADLIARGRQVVIAADAVASRSERNRDLALAAARDLGCLVLPTETIVFRWLRQASGPAFKEISALVR
jgi:nicotinamidase-related amidase